MSLVRPMLFLWPLLLCCWCRICETRTAGLASVIIIANNTAPTSCQLALLPLPFLYPSPPKPPIFIALVLDPLPYLLQALFTDGALRLRAGKRLIYSHEADKWKQRALGSCYLFPVQWCLQSDTENGPPNLLIFRTSLCQSLVWLLAEACKH